MQPDILVVCGEIKNKYLDFAPALVAEVLSPSTALKDKHSKFSIYEQQGISYCLIIDPGKKMLEIYKLVNGNYTLQNPPQNFAFSFANEYNAEASFANLFE